jgi:Kdo2-lipid IVA lauroyltransferase/acyltransferase
MHANDTAGKSWADWLSDLALRLVIRALLALPYRWRVPAMGWVARRVIAPITGYDRRSAANLHMILGDMPAARRDRIIAGVGDNMGRTFIENYSTRPFLKRMARTPLDGPGVVALEQARASGQPVILVSGHFGNYEAPRAALVARGYNVGGLYRAAHNKFFNRHYARTMHAFGGPVFEQGRKGTAGFVRHLKSGGLLVLLFDQHVIGGASLPFMGVPAATATSAAQLALRYGALLVPFYGIRAANGIDFKVEFEAPITHTDPETMTLALNASLEARIRTNPQQWLWSHRRWRTPGRRSPATTQAK